jgi:hypothetical protein
VSGLGVGKCLPIAAGEEDEVGRVHVVIVQTTSRCHTTLLALAAASQTS